MSASARMDLDVVVVGGGIAGLWTLTLLRERGYRALCLESAALGHGQTIASQGILHGGLKYVLKSKQDPAAAAIAEMPMIWRQCLAGERSPDLRGTRMRGEFCHMWRTSSFSSRLAFLGARAGLRITPSRISKEERPAALQAVRGSVARVDEQVLEPVSLLGVLADLNAGSIWKVDDQNGVEFEHLDDGSAECIRLINPDDGAPIDLYPRATILTAGEGNASIRARLGLDQAGPSMQRRPLHMVMARSRNLPMLNGHCVDGRATRLTITSAINSADEIVWQIGGQISERGVDMEPAQLIRYARDEVNEVIPGLDLTGVVWSTYRVDRAEHATPGQRRPAHAYVGRDGRTITVWPTKLVLAPVVGDQCVDIVESICGEPSETWDRLPRDLGWAAPPVALPPWELNQSWVELTD